MSSDKTQTPIKPKPVPVAPPTIRHGDAVATVTGTGFNLQYPSDLESNPQYGENKVIFFIYVHSDSKISRGAGGASDARLTVSGAAIPGTRANFDKATANIKGAAAAAATVAAVAAAPFTIVKGAAQSAADAMGVQGAFDGQVGSLLGQLAPATYKQLNAAISLHTPASLDNTYSVDWGAEDMSKAHMTADVINAVGDLTDGLGKVASQNAGMVASILGSKYEGAAKIASWVTGKTPGNSKEEQLFKGVGFRTFSFDYSFMPKSKEEAASIMAIIRMFRHHMLPEYADENRYIFIYPSRFQIAYFIGNTENPYIEKQMMAVLESMKLTYADGSQFTSFADGMPTKLHMSLTFKELSLPTKETSPFDQHGV